MCLPSPSNYALFFSWIAFFTPHFYKSPECVPLSPPKGTPPESLPLFPLRQVKDQPLHVVFFSMSFFESMRPSRAPPATRLAFLAFLKSLDGCGHSGDYSIIPPQKTLILLCQLFTHMPCLGTHVLFPIPVFVLFLLSRPSSHPVPFRSNLKSPQLPLRFTDKTPSSLRGPTIQFSASTTYQSRTAHLVRRR